MKCRLCLQEKDVINSHILPEFLYEPLYPKNGNKHRRFFALSNNPAKRTEYEQKGYREELLCHDCDNRLIGQHEKYAKDIIHKINHKIKNKLVLRLLKIEGVNYKSFKLFQMSILWRASIAKRQEFKNIELSPANNEKLRQMILHQDPGHPKDFGCQINYPVCKNKILKQMITPQLIIPPEPIEIDGYEAYRVFFSNLFWIFFVTKEFDMIYEELFLATTGILPVFKIKRYAEDFLHNYAIEMGIANRKRKSNSNN